jgi:hypothetical protein
VAAALSLSGGAAEILNFRCVSQQLVRPYRTIFEGMSFLCHAYPGTDQPERMLARVSGVQLRLPALQECSCLEQVLRGCATRARGYLLAAVQVLLCSDPHRVIGCMAAC